MNGKQQNKKKQMHELHVAHARRNRLNRDIGIVCYVVDGDSKERARLREPNIRWWPNRSITNYRHRSVAWTKPDFKLITSRIWLVNNNKHVDCLRYRYLRHILSSVGLQIDKPTGQLVRSISMVTSQQLAIEPQTMIFNILFRSTLKNIVCQCTTCYRLHPRMKQIHFSVCIQFVLDKRVKRAAHFHLENRMH